MNLISENECKNLGELRAILDVVLSPLKVGRGVFIYKREDCFEVRIVEGEKGDER